METRYGLRELARAFFERELTIGQYRHERAILLEEITAPKKKAGLRLCFTPNFHSIGQIIISNRITCCAVAVITILSAIALFFFFHFSESVPPESANQQVSSKIVISAEPIIITTQISAIQLVQAFLDETDWSEEAVSELRVQLDLLSEEEFSDAKESGDFGRLIEALLLYLKTQEQRIERLNLDLDIYYLYDFAEYLGAVVPVEKTDGENDFITK